MKSKKFPKYVAESNGRIVYRPRWKGDPPEGHKIDSRGFIAPPIKLGKAGDPLDAIMAAYQEALERLNPAETKRKVYGYCRVSTTAQDAERQRLDIFEYASKHKLPFPEIVTETISSRKEGRQIFELIGQMKAGDILIVTELSRLGRSMVELHGMIADVLKRKASIHVATGKPIDASIESQCMVFAFGIAAQVERDMISERTKSALAARKAAGVKLGRPCGKGVKMDEALVTQGWTTEQVLAMKSNGVSASKIADLLSLDRRTVGEWLISQKANCDSVSQ